MRRLWVLSIAARDGFRFQPEIYRSRQGAEFGLGAWIRGLDRKHQSKSAFASGGSTRVKIAGLNASIDPVLTDEIEMTSELWVGAVFASDGSISDGPVIHQHQGHARGWVGAQGLDDRKRTSAERPGDDTTRRFKQGGHQFFVTSTRAKVIAPFSAVVTMDLPNIVQPSTYDIDVIASFTHVMSTSISAQPGLSREALESRIDEDFPHLGFQRGMLTDLSWELDDFRERPGLRYRIQPEEGDPEEPRPRVVTDP
jgi:hypothetical protein